ncbi:hypothetical protein SDC9_131563 [bioreactor metagenome]|uniref:Uncharacterized protein n=1 Tax=bioreactor metagenome TaxID=1076179 RepID=A0A645D5H7_9ZZZZ
MPVFVVRAAHGAADAGGGFVAGDGGFQKLKTVHVQRLADGHGGGEGGRAGVVDGFAVDVVHLGGVRCRAVDERGGAGGCGAAQWQARLALVELQCQRFFDHGRGGHGVAGQQRAIPVHERALGVVDDVFAHVGGVEVGGVLAQLFAHEHGDFSPERDESFCPAWQGTNAPIIGDKSRRACGRCVCKIFQNIISGSETGRTGRPVEIA